MASAVSDNKFWGESAVACPSPDLIKIRTEEIWGYDSDYSSAHAASTCGGIEILTGPLRPKSVAKWRLRREHFSKWSQTRRAISHISFILLLAVSGFYFPSNFTLIMTSSPLWSLSVYISIFTVFFRAKDAVHIMSLMKCLEKIKQNLSYGEKKRRLPVVCELSTSRYPCICHINYLLWSVLLY